MLSFIRDNPVKALIDEVEFSCKSWADPEEMGIKGYVLYARKTSAQKATPMLKISQFDPSNPPKIRFPLGTFEFSAEITDIWGAKSLYIISESIDILEPTNDERIYFEDSGIKDQIKESYFKLYELDIKTFYAGKWRFKDDDDDLGSGGIPEPCRATDS